ncbi:hypothetical protein LO772_06100 [Yinghuangia sp. ASG 101]|uniref:hypothetical protein n=1 Tax=Yinghuangia sp. ASG 101 TaxID=2896848 RepID=UPI001E49EAFD|nr:hypothetical protein [Yinghuangia sp. ASG 101]UGQ13185.1 hypothetical protein LO772_06100 [Yinghuangia sp. ASG 101]
MRVGITGHRGLGGDVAAFVRKELADVAATYDPAELVAVSCIADGPDTWWPDAVLARRGRIEVVIPAERYRAGLPDAHYADYDRLLAAATDTHYTGITDSTEQAHMAGSEILVGLVDELLAVWDGQPARGYGGTADVVAYAERVGVPVRVIWPDGVTRD